MITITIQDTPAGVVIGAAGPLHAIGDAAWVARCMVEHAAPLFAGGKQVLLGGAADPVKNHRPDELEDEVMTPLCTCDLNLTPEELDFNKCSACGKAVLA